MTIEQEALIALTSCPAKMAEFCKRYHVDSISGLLSGALEAKEVRTEKE